jgi:hypothetical protein
MSENTQPKEEKKSFKEQFLELVASQGGLYSAATMEDALKHQNKQLEEAMLSGGKSIPEISQSIGIDYNKLFSSQLKPPEQPTMPKAGGLFGMLGGQDPASAQVQLQNKALLQKISGTEPTQPYQQSEVDLRKAQTINELASASKNQALADMAGKGTIQHISSITGQPTTADDPDAITMMMLPNGQTMQIDKMQDLKGVADTIKNRIGQIDTYTKNNAGLMFNRQESNSLKQEKDSLIQKLKDITERLSVKAKIAGKKLDRSTATEILKLASGDKEKARQIARQRGYEF